MMVKLSSETLKAKVYEALTNAEENGYFKRGPIESEMQEDPLHIACDLVMCCADLEDQNPDELVPFIETWMEGE